MFAIYKPLRIHIFIILYLNLLESSKKKKIRILPLPTRIMFSLNDKNSVHMLIIKKKNHNYQNFRNFCREINLYLELMYR